MVFRKVFRSIARAFAGGRTVRDLAERLGIPLDELRQIKVDYRGFRVPKRSGGHRRILAPTYRLKVAQRRILRRVLSGLKAHPAAKGFERGLSIADNARTHEGRGVVINLDLVDFFPSITAERVRGLFRRCRWGWKASETLTELCTYEGRLPQGAPTSPRLSNIVNVYLDSRLARLAINYEAKYTRYADDITFSFSSADRRKIHGIIRLAKKIIRSEGYAVHRRKKLSIRRAHQRQEVTGLVVNQRAQLPRETRRWLRAVRRRFETKKKASISRAQLQGWDALQKMLQVERP